MTTAVTHEDAARLLAQAEATRVPISPIRELLAPKDLDAAYRIQEINILRREAAGAVRVGRKIGLTAPAVQKQFQVDEPDYGVLLDGMTLSHGGTLDLECMIHPKIEAEVAFVLAADITETDLASIRSAVDYVAPSLEVVDCRIRDYDIDIVDTISDNAAVAYYVLGDERVRLDDIDLPSVSMRLTCGDEIISEGTGSDCMGDPLNAVQWLARTAIAQGRPLRRGEVILSGSLGPIGIMQPGKAHTAVFDGLGSATVHTTTTGGDE
ncbi:fumarylacetoacetate hydrolase family protein [Rhodococcus hoagii]|nr:fumarylacetoacetate hydrolase family protein [Prescottella equi]